MELESITKIIKFCKVYGIVPLYGTGEFPIGISFPKGSIVNLEVKDKIEYVMSLFSKDEWDSLPRMSFEEIKEVFNL
jgi:hypothetical protein